jgi:hypothetical protein
MSRSERVPVALKPWLSFNPRRIRDVPYIGSDLATIDIGHSVENRPRGRQGRAENDPFRARRL